RRSTRSAGGSTGASASRSSSSKLGSASFMASPAPHRGGIGAVARELGIGERSVRRGDLRAILADDLLELLDGAVDQHLGRAVGAAERAGNLSVVHAQREAHDQRLATVVGKLAHAIQYAAALVAHLAERLGGGGSGE